MENGVDFSPSFMLKFSKYPNSNFGWSYGHLNKNIPPKTQHMQYMHYVDITI